MPGERTPLVQTVIVTRPPPRYPHSTFRRFCTIALSCTLILAIIGTLIPFTILPHDHHHREERNPHHWSQSASSKQWSLSQGLSFDDLQQILLETPSKEKSREWTQYYASGPHLAGKNLSQAIWTRERWEEFGVKSEIVAYDSYLNYPVDHRLALLKGKKGNYTVKYECSLKEDVLEEDPTTGLKDRVPTFHGYSANGNVTASYVYVNHGTYWDFEDLVKANVSLKGKIAIAKYGANFRGLKVKRAQELGMVGIVIYSDPGDDGNMTESNGYKAYPDGPARNPSSVQRGSVQFISVAPGDPTTPGYPSKPGVPRADPSELLPHIPSIPISYRDAIPLLKALNGHGPQASSFSEFWHGGGLAHEGIEYNIGPSPKDIVLNLVNEQEYVTTPIWNVIGIINGTIPDEVVILGNHRDAWIAGGAGDPNSGSAAMNEVIRSFGEALKAGWKPLRTVVFASWDGEEYALIGSTEWVEEYIPWLNKSAVAYINMDVGASGTHFSASSAPLLRSLLFDVTSIVPSPKGGSIQDNWDGNLRTIGSGSDYTAFQDFAGISSLDVGFNPGPDDPVYHYHSNYDSFHWMDEFGDSHWKYHVAIAQVAALTAARLIDMPIIPMNATDYAVAIDTYIHSLKKKADNSQMSSQFDFTRLDVAKGRLFTSAVAFDTYTSQLSDLIRDQLPWWKWWQKVRLFYQVRRANDKYKTMERQFLYSGGLDGRTWFKHVVFSPGRWTGYAGATFPGLIESFEDGNLTNANRWAEIIEERLNNAITVLG